MAPAPWPSPGSSIRPEMLCHVEPFLVARSQKLICQTGGLDETLLQVPVIFPDLAGSRWFGPKMGPEQA